MTRLIVLWRLQGTNDQFKHSRLRPNKSILMLESGCSFFFRPSDAAQNHSRAQGLGQPAAQLHTPHIQHHNMTPSPNNSLTTHMWPHLLF